MKKETKHDLKHAKIKMHEQINEIKAESKFSSKVEKYKQLDKVVKPHLMKSEIILSGVKNKYAQADNIFKLAEKTYEEAKDSNKKSKSEKTEQKLKEAKTKLIKAHKSAKVQKAILYRETKLINKLNDNAKGSVVGKNGTDEIITVKKANKYYATKALIFKALNDVNISIKRGSFNVILGPSGSGKTTLLNIISGLDRATSGEIVINGTNISALSTGQLTQFRRKEIGFIFQSYNLLSSLDVNDNIEVGRSLQTDANKRKNIKELLSNMDMENDRNKKTYELSGGQQQRVSIARALSKSPSILIGDEPTGALDQATSLKVFELFQRINKENNATVIIVTHNTNVAKLADMVIKVKDGKIEKIEHNKKPALASSLKEI